MSDELHEMLELLSATKNICIYFYIKDNKKDLFVRNEVCENEMTWDES